MPTNFQDGFPKTPKITLIELTLAKYPGTAIYLSDMIFHNKLIKPAIQLLKQHQVNVTFYVFFRQEEGNLNFISHHRLFLII